MADKKGRYETEKEDSKKYQAEKKVK